MFVLKNSRAVVPVVSRYSRSFSSTLVRKEGEQGDGKQNAGFIKSVLYGKELEGAGNVLAPEEVTHSKKLARGKYVHEMQSKYDKERVFVL